MRWIPEYTHNRTESKRAYCKGESTQHVFALTNTYSLEIHLILNSMTKEPNADGTKYGHSKCTFQIYNEALHEHGMFLTHLWKFPDKRWTSSFGVLDVSTCMSIAACPC